MLTIGDFNSFWGFLGHPVQYSTVCPQKGYPTNECRQFEFECLYCIDSLMSPFCVILAEQINLQSTHNKYLCKRELRILLDLLGS